MTDNSWIYEDPVIYNYLSATPYNPLRTEDGYPVYSRNDIDLYGQPDYYGIHEYLVIDDIGQVFRTDFSFEQGRRGSLRPIHRYSRLSRFRNTLHEIVGARSLVPQKILDAMQGCYDPHPASAWEGIRYVLKDSKLTRYVNMIPSILRAHGLDKSQIPDQKFLDTITRQFMGMCDKFKYLDSPRKYFPNLRFVCVRLLEINGYVFPISIPRIRTPRKVKPMEDILQLLLN